MNAYELAKQLEERHAPYEDDAANMLRQQADRIDELEKELIRYADALGEARNKKPLSDEEITEIYYPFSLAKYQFNMASPMFDTLGFVRAIEERHGIK